MNSRNVIDQVTLGHESDVWVRFVEAKSTGTKGYLWIGPPPHPCGARHTGPARRVNLKGESDPEISFFTVPSFGLRVA